MVFLQWILSIVLMFGAFPIFAPANIARPEIQDSFQTLRVKAERGDSAAQLQLGLAYEHGYYGGRDYPKAMEWIRKSSDQGNNDAEEYLGELYEGAPGIQTDYRQALRCYEHSAAHGNLNGEVSMAFLFLYGHGVKKDENTALRLLNDAVKQGNAYGEKALGFFYQYGYGVPQSYSTAMRWYLKAASKGNYGAYNNVGFLYDQALGFPEDALLAAVWYRKAIVGDDPSAENNLGRLYDEGRGVPQSYAIALSLYHLAAAQGLASAEYHLGVLYEFGHGVQRDLDEARQWYQKAAHHGDRRAIDRLLILESSQDANHSTNVLLDQLLSFTIFFCIADLPCCMLAFLYQAAMRRSESSAHFRSNFLNISAACLFTSAFSLVIFSSLLTTNMRNEVRTFLDRSGTHIEISVNGKSIANSAPIVHALHSIAWVMAHHSHPTDTLWIEVRSDQGIMTLQLRRDSERRQEYWVFFPYYRNTRLNEIGRIVSSAFDQFDGDQPTVPDIRMSLSEFPRHLPKDGQEPMPLVSIISGNTIRGGLAFSLLRPPLASSGDDRPYAHSRAMPRLAPAISSLRRRDALR